MIETHDVLGLSGVALGIFSYARVQWRRDFAKTLDYSLMNFIGSVLIIISLMHNWNLPAFVSNLLWILISLYGMYRCLKYAYRARVKKLLEEKNH